VGVPRTGVPATGDAFCAARACAAGAIAASRPDAQPSLPTAAKLEEILAR
jgi:sugar/nucleoside kinase (ribokinase family)